MLHYYCRKQHKNIKNSKQNLVLLLPFSLFTVTCASYGLPQRQSFFISWRQYSANFKHHKWSFLPYIVLFSGSKVFFSLSSQLDTTACIKNCIYNNFNFRCFMSSIVELLYKSFSLISSSVQILLELEILRNSSVIFRSSHRRCPLK